MPENFFANTKKEAIFNIFLGKKNFWDTFVTQKNGKIHVWGLISLKNSSIGPCRALGQSDTFFGALFLPKIWEMPTLGFD